MMSQNQNKQGTSAHQQNGISFSPNQELDQSANAMEAEDLYGDSGTGIPGWKVEKVGGLSGGLQWKLADKGFYNDFGDLFDPEM